MSTALVSSKRTKIQKVCTLWTHDENFSKETVVFNEERFPELSLSPTSLIQILALKHAPAVRDFQVSSKSNTRDGASGKGDESGQDGHTEARSRRSRRGSVKITLDENGTVISGGRDVDTEKSYIFVAKPMSSELRSKHPTLHISITEKVAKVFGFRNRLQVVVTEADEETHSASHVEITFRDEYLARADMWRMAISELSNRTVYRGQKLLFIGTIKATIKNVYIHGRSEHSGYFSPMTKPIFRSESARYVLFIQMSKEMWDFDAEGAGEIMFNKVVNGFLPDLFKRWMKINARHLVTIILFTRMSYDGEPSLDGFQDTTSSTQYEKESQRFRDYYRVVVSDMASGDWINILYQLKKEFRAFLRDVSLVPRSTRYSSTTTDTTSASDSPDLVISGKPSTASQGNILEAINLASAQFAKDYIDRDLVRTGISVVVITAGTGVFEVDYNMLKLTTDTLIGSGIGIDLVCLSPMPLHSVPLFKYRSPRTVSEMKAADVPDDRRNHSHGEGLSESSNRTPRQLLPNFGALSQDFSVSHSETVYEQPSQLDADEWRYAMPHWIDISFWSGPSGDITELANPSKMTSTKARTRQKGSTFALRCRMYELQMMGVMESELGGISIPYMEESPSFPHQLSEHSATPFAKSIGGSDKFLGRPKANSAYALPKQSGSAEDGSERITKFYEDFMDNYDVNAFSALADGDSQGTHTPADNHGQRASPEKYSSDTLYSTSFRSVASSFRHSKRPTPERSFHPLGREVLNEYENQSPRSIVYRPGEGKTKVVPRADVVYRQLYSNAPRPPGYHRRGGSGESHDHRRSLHSTPNDSPAISRANSPPKRSGLPPLPGPITAPVKPEQSSKPGGWFLRQISFGARGASVAKPTASVAAIDITPGDVKPARLTVENNQKGAIAAKLASTRPTETESKSKPIAIKAASRPGTLSAELPSSDEAARSVETVRGAPLPRPSVESHRGSVTKDPGSTFLLAGSRALVESIGPKLDIASSGGGKVAPRTLSPTSAIAPWAVLVNPCNPKKNNIHVASQFRRWQHVFPKQLKTASVKWKSLCSPAAVPLTNEYFPSAEQLATEYNESPYKIAQNDEDDALDAPKSRETLVRELIAFRLSHGFQIIVGPTVAAVTGRREQDLSNILHSDYMSHDGDTVFMCVGNTIHQLVCAAGGEVEVKRFSRKPTTALQSSAGIDTPFPYKPFIRTAFEDTYQSRDIILRPLRREYNWNFIDTFLAGYHDEFSDILRFWRARFVLIPVEIPSLHRRTIPLLTEDSEEEIRLEGIRKLTQLWQKHRYIPPEERHFQATNDKRRKDPNPLAIEYHTRDPSTIVAAGPDAALLTDVDTEFQTSIFSETDQYHTSNIDIKRLAEDLQGEKGIPMLDRRWHWRLHYNCFLGSDLTSWLLSNFRDIETRDEAVDLGNQLMNKGLFQHVQKRHQFRDGQFFFQIAAEYRAPRPDTRLGWFGMKKTDRSIPSTPLSEGPRTSPLTGRSIKSRPSQDDSCSTSESVHEGEKTPTRAVSPKRKVTLSRVMRYDVDARKRSYRPEIISLHYDRLHNPDNCYHIRIDWMNVTAKLIEDAIVTWATSVEKYGLKLVEVPIAEASNIVDHHPFRSPYIVKLALQPPKSLPERVWDPSHFSPQPRTDKFAYHKALLRRLNYVLDVEAASSFPPDVEVTYSWGRPDYKYTQFIHRSGTVLAQITNEGDFLLLANRLAHNRAKDNTKFRPTDPYDHKRTTATSTTPAPTNPSTPAIDKVSRSPFSSPLARPVQDSSLLHTALQSGSVSTLTTSRSDTLPFSVTPEQVKEEIESFCSDPLRLKQFYDQALQQTPGPSPHIGPVLDANIPSLGLPPAINIREASPATSAGWAGMGTPRIEAPSSMARRYAGGEGSVGSGSSAATVVQKRASASSEGGSVHRRRDSQGSSGTGVSGG